MLKKKKGYNSLLMGRFIHLFQVCIPQPTRTDHALNDLKFLKNYAQLYGSDAKVHMHQVLIIFLLANKRWLKTEKKLFLPFINICLCSKDMTFESFRNFEKKMEQEN